jgi:hypothetical protein
MLHHIEKLSLRHAQTRRSKSIVKDVTFNAVTWNSASLRMLFTDPSPVDLTLSK